MRDAPDLVLAIVHPKQNKTDLDETIAAFENWMWEHAQESAIGVAAGRS